MGKFRNISAVFFAFMLAAVIGVGTASAYDIPPIGQCPDPDTNGQTTYECPVKDTNGKSGGTQNNNQSGVTQSQAQQSYTQSQQAAPQVQTNEQAESTSKQQKATPKPTPTPSETPATDVAGATEEPQPFLPLWALLGIAVVAGAYAFTMRRFTGFWQL